MRTSWLLVLVLVGCAADSDEPPSRDDTLNVDVSVVRESSQTSDADMALDVCALASELPLDDVCSLICDPAAMAARMALDGSDAGTCYQLYCALPGGEHVLVGVCLPP